MKVGIIGVGGVGAACLTPLIQLGDVSEIVLLDINYKRAKAIATDMQYGATISSSTNIYAGEYSDLANAAVVMITAGINEKTGGATDRNDPAGRLKLLKTNVTIYRDIVPKLVSAAPNAVILVVTDPPDPLTDLTRQLAGHNHVLSSGTYLDSLRFRFHLAKHCGVNPQSVNAQVVGEHGTAEVFLWSSANICGVSLDAFVKQENDSLKEQIEKEVRFANITIIEGNNASQYGIGMVSARITEMILRDENAVIPIGSYQENFGVTLSLPSIVGRSGVVRSFEPKMSDSEKHALQECAQRLKQVKFD